MLRIPVFLCLLALAGLACGEDEAPLNEEVPLNAVVSGPVPSGTVNMSGIADPAGKRGFIFSQQSVSVFVSAPASVSQAINAGEQVRVEATVKRMSAGQARRIEASLPEQFGDSPNVEGRAVADTRIEPGAAYLELEQIEN